MPKGFFHVSETLSSKAPTSMIAKCGACGLYKQCRSPKMEPSGKGRRKILIIAEAPGKEEDRTGVHLTGESARLLESELDRYGVDVRKDCYFTNAVICRPPDNKEPTPDQLDYCAPNLTKTIKDLDPEIIIPLGASAVKSLLRGIWKEDVGAITRWAGWQIPSQRINAWICPTYHPSHILRAKRDKVLELHFRHHLKTAVRLRGRPWDEGVPDYESQIERVYDPRKAARIIREFTERGGLTAFDYEATSLKPEVPGTRILSCSICWRGKRTIAYPWVGEAIEATSEYLRSKNTWKIASNMKFEQRWTMVHLGHRVTNWAFDTMQGAHVIDNRKAITGLKFQSFVTFGNDTYDDHIERLLEQVKGSQLNQAATEISLPDLLQYNGMDSLLEYLLAVKQMEYLNYDYRTGEARSEVSKRSKRKG